MNSSYKLIPSKAQTKLNSLKKKLKNTTHDKNKTQIKLIYKN